MGLTRCVILAGSDVNGFQLTGLDDFEYKDPVDGSVATKQGVRYAAAPNATTGALTSY